MKTDIVPRMLGAAALIVLTGLAAAVPSADAQLGFAAVAPLNTTAPTDTGSDLRARVALDYGGHAVAVWESSENVDGAGADFDILFSRSDDGGATWAAPSVLNSNGARDSGADRNPALATDGIGTWIAVWESAENLGGAGADVDLFYAISMDQGISWTAPRPLNRNAATDAEDDFEPHVDTDQRGVWVAAWHTTENTGGAAGSDQDLLFARSVDHGQTWTAPVALNSNAGTDEGDDFNVSLGNDGAGAWVAAWSSNEAFDGDIESDSDIVFCRSTDNGATWSAPALLHAGMSSDDGEDFAAQVRNDKIGTWAAVWESGSSLGGTVDLDQDIHVSRSTDGGLSWSAPAALNADAAVDADLDSRPDLAVDARGRWIAVWHAPNEVTENPGFDSDVMISYSTDAAATWSSPAAIATNASYDDGDDLFVGIATDGRSRWAAFWQSEDSLQGTVGTDADIFCVVADEPFFWDVPATLNTDAGTDSDSDSRPRLAGDGAGNWVAVWQSSEDRGGAGTDVDVFAAASSDDGATWSAPIALNSNANIDSVPDLNPTVCTDGRGSWIALWDTTADVAGSGADQDVFLSRSSDNGATWSAMTPLDPNALLDAGSDFDPALATDGAGSWVAVWNATGSFGGDFDCLVSHSVDGGITWSTATPLNTSATVDVEDDFEPQVATDEAGRWVAVWFSNNPFTGALPQPLGTDDDILYSESTDNGATWTDPAPLNSNAAGDGAEDDDFAPQVATDGRGNWLVVWFSEGTLGNTIGKDLDILESHAAGGTLNWSPVQPLNANAATDSGDDNDVQLTTDREGTWLAAWTTDEPALAGLSAFNGDIAYAVSRDAGATWTPPSILNQYGTTDSGDDSVVSLGYDASGGWIAVWASQEDIAGAGPDADIVSAAVPVPKPDSARITSIVRSGGSIILSWSPLVPPYLVYQTDALTPALWSPLGTLLHEPTATLPVNSSHSCYRVRFLGLPGSR